MAAIQRQAEFSPGTIESFQDILKALRTHLSMDVAFVTEFMTGRRFFHAWDSNSCIDGLGAGSTLADDEGYCAYVRSGQLPRIIPDTAKNLFAMSLAATHTVPIGSHLSVPIVMSDGSVFGSFCCFSFKPAPHLSSDAMHLMNTFSTLIANKIETELGQIRAAQAKVARIRGAIKRNDPKIVFQPIVRLTDLAIVGVEALSRFKSLPSRSPDAWFGEANEVGLASTLELLACRKAINAARSLPSSISVNLNISPSVLVGIDVSALTSGIDPRRVVVEMTEHSPVSDYTPLIRAVDALRSKGVRIAIDDAGAGYSSLRHVLAIKPDIIKLDISLTRDIHLDGMKEAMAAALVAFSTKTRCTIVAEGVETEAELEKLRELGIQKGQGYFLGLPQEAKDFASRFDPLMMVG